MKMALDSKPEKLNGDSRILDTCLDLHMQHTGSLERQDTYEDCIKFLREKLATWKPTLLPISRDFDNAVKSLIQIVLRESDAIKNPKEEEPLPF